MVYGAFDTVHIAAERVYHTLPIVITLCIHNTTEELMSLQHHVDQSFLMQLGFNHVYASAITTSAAYIDNNPFVPLLATQYFLCQRKRLVSKIHNSCSKSSSVLTLDMWKEAASEEVKTCAIDNITSQSIIHMEAAKSMLIKDVVDGRQNFLDQVVCYIGSLSQNHGSSMKWKECYQAGKQ